MNTAVKLIVCAAAFGLSLTQAAAQQPAVVKTNLFTNPSFENGLDGWSFAAHEKHETIAVDTVEKHDGNSSIRIDTPAGDDSFLQQTVNEKPKTQNWKKVSLNSTPAAWTPRSAPASAATPAWPWAPPGSMPSSSSRSVPPANADLQTTGSPSPRVLRTR